MQKSIVLCLVMLLGAMVNAQTINLRGVVSNRAGKPIANAVLTLAKQGLKDTTGSDGAYALSQITAAKMPLLLPQKQSITIDRGFLEISLPASSPVSVEIFDVKGHLLKKEVSTVVSAGFYRLNVEDVSRTAKLLVVKASIGTTAYTFRYLPLYRNAYQVNLASQHARSIGEKLSKVAAIDDTIKITAPNFAAKDMAITSYEQQLDITLDTMGGGAGSSSGCGKTPTLKSGSRTIKSGSDTRNYMIRIPENYDNTHPYPLVFAFHWRGGTMTDVDGGGSSGYAWSYYGIRELADKSANSQMIFVAPDGNGGWANSNGRDVTLVDDLLKLIKGDLCIDTTRIFAMGFSWGGGMSYALACGRPKVFRAVAVYAGMELSGCVGGELPVAYIGIHGVVDRTNNISAGRSLRDRYVKNNGCTAQNPPEPSAGSGKHIVTSYSGCKAGYPVIWAAFDGDHTPGNVDGGGDDGAKTWTKAEVWKFFTQF